MFERFTDQARQVIVLARDEALSLGHDHIGTEHMLLALLGDNGGAAGRTLRSLGITPARVRSQIVRLVGEGDQRVSGRMPFTPRAKVAFERALREALAGEGREALAGEGWEALAAREGRIEPKHLLLGIVGEGEGVGARILREADVDLGVIRNELAKPG